MDEPNRLTIDLSALVHNLGQIRKLIGKDTKIMGIVKSDAYGHGLVQISLELEKHGIDSIGVAHFQEALALRKHSITVPIVILCGINTREEATEVIERRLTPVLFDLKAAEILSEESKRLGKKTKVHLKVDTGMGRLGISYEEILPFMKKIMTMNGLTPSGLTSHLSSADKPGCKFTEQQLNRFNSVVKAARSIGMNLSQNNLANSAGILYGRRTSFDMVRPGIMLYGGLPSPDLECPVSLAPVMNFRGHILQIRRLPADTPVSYGGTYRTKEPREIAVISTGYGDGLPRSMSNQGMAIIRGKRAPIIGRICMNLTICDITDISGVRISDEAVFLGRQDEETITGDDIAKWAGTISYEIFCSIGQRNKKEYL